MPKKKKEKKKALNRDIPTPSGYLDDNRYITPGLKHDDRPYVIRLPSLDDMRGMSDADLAILLNHYGVTEPWDTLRIQAMDYVKRMAPLKTEAEIEAETKNLIGSERRALLGMCRRISQQWSTLDAIDGNVLQELIWITEDDEATCDRCAPRGGQIETFVGWKMRGMPGSEVCDGGNYCRCDLVAID